MITMVTIHEYLLRLQHLPVIDVRSPGEYAHAHIPGAVSLPLFSDEERKVVGTIYKHQGKQKAIKVGLDYFGVKMRPMVEWVEEMLSKNGGEERSVVVHCWRGGMRSAGVAWLLDLYGFNVFTIVGGYKAYRRWALQQFEKQYDCRILGGYTGSGKSEILSQISKLQAVVDLESLANHQGSAFGGIGRGAQPSQEMFENKLALALSSVENKKIWLEDESQRIGNCMIPNALWTTMRQSKVLFIEVPFEERLKRILADYGTRLQEKLVEATLRIQKRLGPNETKMVIQYLAEGNIEEGFRILLKYYDKLYGKSLFNREGAEALIEKTVCNDVNEFISKFKESDV